MIQSDDLQNTISSSDMGQESSASPLLEAAFFLFTTGLSNFCSTQSGALLSHSPSPDSLCLKSGKHLSNWRGKQGSIWVREKKTEQQKRHYSRLNIKVYLIHSIIPPVFWIFDQVFPEFVPWKLDIHLIKPQVSIYMKQYIYIYTHIKKKIQSTTYISLFTDFLTWHVARDWDASLSLTFFFQRHSFITFWSSRDSPTQGASYLYL